MIVGSNNAGKSTIIEAIRAMFICNNNLSSKPFFMQSKVNTIYIKMSALWNNIRIYHIEGAYRWPTFQMKWFCRQLKN
jgi:AAA15 family ATPase/GTPase